VQAGLTVDGPYDVIGRLLDEDPAAYWCLGTRDACDVFREDGDGVLSWRRQEELPEGTGALRVIPGRVSQLTTIPSVVGRLPRLRFLEMPAPMLSDLALERVPPSIETLQLVNPRHTVDFAPRWDGLRALRSLRYVTFHDEFGADPIREQLSNFPLNDLRLDYLSFNLSKCGPLTEGINRRHTLKTVMVTDLGGFPLAEHLPTRIQKVGLIVPGREFSMADLTKFRNLRSVFVNSALGQIDCAAFLAMPSLVELTVYNSKKIVNAGDLADHPRLKRICFVNCGKPFKGVLDRFEPERYEELDIRFS